ncbi:MAG: tRNA lysidine(34) synthetase TilS [Novosphingobium sp.]
MDTALYQRFAADWAAVWPSDAPVGLAVSGGPDSLALLLLAAAALDGSTRGRFRAATVDHGLRGESANEAAAVASLSAERGMAHATLTLDLGPGPALQERARAARYAALGDWADAHGLKAIVTAHHADDQAETLLMRLNRGAGVRGLAAMRAVSTVPGRPGCALLRPLLGWRRSELAEIVTGAAISAADDASNHDLRFERVRMRTDLAGVPWLNSGALAASASHLADADAALDWAAERSLAEAVGDGAALRWAPEDTPRALVLRVLERIAGQMGSSVPRGSAVARWHDQLTAGRIATLAGIRADGRGEVWCFTRAPPPRTTRSP